MKASLCFLAGVLMGALLWTALPHHGRYTLVNYSGDVLRLDTRTGKTWEWRPQGWVALQETVTKTVTIQSENDFSQ